MLPLGHVTSCGYIVSIRHYRHRKWLKDSEGSAEKTLQVGYWNKRCSCGNIHTRSVLKKLRTIKHTFQFPRGIAVDKEDNLFISDSDLHCVYKLDKDGKQLKVIGERGSGNGEFNFPRGVAVIGEHVFVCDTENHRIQVFSRKLEFVKIIGSRGTGNGQFNHVRDISQDEAGNLYVCDRNNHRIQVLNSEGEFLYSFGTKGNGKGQLDAPVVVCVSDLYVYVSEWGNNRVSVFDRKGYFVASFGRFGSAEGCFCNPYILRVDKDGFVYVCEYGNNRVQIF